MCASHSSASLPFSSARTLLYLKKCALSLLLCAGLSSCTTKKQQGIKTSAERRSRPARSPLFKAHYRYTWNVPFSPKRGPRDAPIQVVELLNPLHPQSAAIHRLRSEVWAKFAGEVRWTIRFNPRLGGDQGYYRSRALLVAHRSEHFWTFLPRLFRNKGPMNYLTLRKIAESIGIDPDQFEVALQDPMLKLQIDRDMRWSARLGKLGQPGLLVNGSYLPAPYTAKRVLEALYNTQQRAKYWMAHGTPTAQLQERFTTTTQELPTTKSKYEALQAHYTTIPLQVMEQTPYKGPGDAPIRVVEFSDFTCVPCGTQYKRLRRLLKRYPKAIRFYFKVYPINIHREGQRAAEIAIAAQERRKFWPLYHILFQQQGALRQGHWLKLAKQAKLDTQWLAGELDRHSFRKQVFLHRRQARKLGIRNNAPVTFIDGRKIRGALSDRALDKLVRQELWKAGQPQTKDNNKHKGGH